MYFHIQIVKVQRWDTYYYSAAQSWNQSVILLELQAEDAQHTQSTNQSTNHSTQSDKSTESAQSINTAQSVNWPTNQHNQIDQQSINAISHPG